MYVRQPEYLAENALVNGISYADLEGANGHQVIAVLVDRPLCIRWYDGRLLEIPDAWIMRARRDLNLCPLCVGYGPKVRRMCSHA